MTRHVGMNASETFAKAVVESLIPGARMLPLKSQSQGEHDFDLHLPDGRLALVEVTAAVDAAQRSAHASITNDRQGGQFIPAILSRGDWYVTPSPGAQIKKVRANVDRYLAEIEGEGRISFFAPLDAHESAAVRAIYDDLHVEYGSRVKWNTPRTIVIGLPGKGGWIDPETVNAAIIAEAQKPDNLRKLSTEGYAERHLFLYVDASAFEVHAPLLGGVLVASPPTFPAPMTHGWVASHMSAEFAVVWEAETGGEWRRYECPLPSAEA